MSGPTDKTVILATAGLFAAWVFHDVEEVLTMTATSDHVAGQIEQSSLEWVRAMAPYIRTDTKESALAITFMGALIAAASAQGMLTMGRSLFFQFVLAGLHAHVYSHVGASLRLRGYSTGVVSAAVIMAPYSVWARQVLRSKGVLVEGFRPYVVGGALLLPATLACHALAGRILR